MSRTLTVMGRELRAFFFSPMSYVIAFLFVFFQGWQTVVLVDQCVLERSDMDLFPLHHLAGNTAAVMMTMIIPPILTMRLFSEEKRTGSMELLMTTPVTDLEVTLGKWLAALVFFMVLRLPSLVLMLLLQSSWLLGLDFPLWTVFSVTLWVLLSGALILAIGLFSSSLTQNMLASSLIGIVISAVLFIGPSTIATSAMAPKEGILLELVDTVYLLKHLHVAMGRGLIDTAHIWFYLSATAAFLFFTVRSVEARKWV